MNGFMKRFAVLAAKFKYKGWVFMVAEKPGDFSLRIGGGISFRELLRRIE